MAATILFVDDDESLREVTAYHLRQEGYEVLTAKDGEEALELFTKYNPDVVISDIVMPGMDGMELLRKVKAFSEHNMFITITAHGSIGSAVEAMKVGAFDYIEKPFSSDAIKLSVKKALRVSNLERENRYLREVARDRFQFENIVGKSEKMSAVFQMASRVAARNTTVLILGESGTGKELLAKAIHFNSDRRGDPFIPVNVGAIPEHLVDSELFGHERGAFTGAISRHAGAFERASGGTLFLDEVAEMRPEHQVRLLRVLQEKEINRVGSEKAIQTDVRVIAATNRDLDEMVGAGEFREDLFYRLSVVPITLPPLRERADDIPLLTMHFLEKFRGESGAKNLRFSPETMKLLSNYGWPGNVRELENAIERCVAMRSSDEIAPDDLPEKYRVEKTDFADLALNLPEGGIVLDDVERRLIVAALEKNRGNQSAAARFLGITRNTLLYRMDKYGLK